MSNIIAISCDFPGCSNKIILEKDCDWKIIKLTQGVYVLKVLHICSEHMVSGDSVCTIVESINESVKK